MKALSVIIVLFFTVARFSWAGNGQSTEETAQATPQAKPTNSAPTQPGPQQSATERSTGTQPGQGQTTQAENQALRTQATSGGSSQGQGANQQSQQTNNQPSESNQEGEAEKDSFLMCSGSLAVALMILSSV